MYFVGLLLFFFSTLSTLWSVQKFQRTQPPAHFLLYSSWLFTFSIMQLCITRFLELCLFVLIGQKSFKFIMYVALYSPLHLWVVNGTKLLIFYDHLIGFGLGQCVTSRYDYTWLCGSGPHFPFRLSHKNEHVFHKGYSFMTILMLMSNKCL